MRIRVGARMLQFTMAELLDRCPQARPVLSRRGMACVGCAMAPFETLAEAARAYGIDAGELLREIAAEQRKR